MNNNKSGLKNSNKNDDNHSTIAVNYYDLDNRDDDDKYNFSEVEQAFEYAVTIWEGWINSDITIEVDVYWEELPSGILGAATPYGFRSNFTGATEKNTWYAMPLANHLAGKDLNGDAPEIKIWLNSEYNISEDESKWYFGTDGNTPNGKHDLVTVVLHELVHGFGLTDYISYSSGTAYYGNSIFESFIVSIVPEKDKDKYKIEKLSEFKNSTDLATQLTSNNLFFSGANAIEANGGEPVKLYAPTKWKDGSSVAHLDETTYRKGHAAGSLMTPYLAKGEVIHDPGAITLGILEDLGWDINEVYSKPVIDEVASIQPVGAAPTSSTPASIITFEESKLTSYAGQDINAIFTISDNFQEIDIQGNGWKKLFLDYKITDKTILEFEFQSNIQGEIQGIGFDTDDNFGSGDDKRLLFQLEGSQDVGGVTDFKDNVTGKGWKTYQIEVGEFFTGEVNYLTFVNDHDGGKKNAHSQFRNLRLYEEGQVVQPVETPSTPPVVETPTTPPVVETPSTPASIITFEETEFTSYARQDKNSTLTISENKQEIDIQGNGWKKASFDYKITDKTILEFEFQSNIKGEIQGIGFDTDDNFGSDDDKRLLFQLEGSQDVGGVTDFKDDVTGKGWKTYQIEVAQYGFTGDINYLTFVNDHDDGKKNAHSQFRNLRLYEQGQLVQPSIINIEESELTSYAGQDKNSTFTISDNKQEIDIQGNGWKKLAFDYQITDKTILEFQFQSNIKGEIQGIGFDTDDKFGSDDDNRLLFQLEGSQDIGVTDFKDDVTGKGWKTYKIEVGKEFTGNVNYLTFVNDHDDGKKNAHSQFRNIKIYEGDRHNLKQAKTEEETKSDVALTVQESTNNYTLFSYGGTSQDKGTYTISDDKTEVEIKGNAWKKFDINNYNITENTVLKFEFQSTAAGEIQGIGFDNDNIIGDGDAKHLFQVSGTQDWGIELDDTYILGSGWQTYEVNVGKQFTGEFDYLTLASDDDVSNSTAQSQFRNISLYEM
jgi:hypothetical protein